MEIEIRPLAGRFVRLEPLAPTLKEDVRAAVDGDPEVWAIMPENPMGARFESWWANVLALPRDQRITYAVRRLSDGRVVGVTSYLGANATQRGVEIGGTFLHADVRSGAVNPETKLLMLAHAFESGALRVAFRVDTRNKRSQAAVAKLGAVREGVLRQDRVTWTGYVRDTAVFSVLDREWPAVRAGLEQRLAAFGAD
ncbi:MAG: GNAT family N-acetyltransferase [Candidatus Eiseniibacteriota bacterium]